MKYKETISYISSNFKKKNFEEKLDNFFEELGTKKGNCTIVTSFKESNSIFITQTTEKFNTSLHLLLEDNVYKLVLNSTTETTAITIEIEEDMEDKYLLSLVQEKIKCITESMLNF